MNKKVVLVTGGSSGIGSSIALFLSRWDYIVYATSRNTDKLKDTSHIKWLSLDVKEEKTIKETIEIIIQQEGRLDVLINNAGVGITGAVEDTPKKEILQVLQTNFFGALNMIQFVLPIMRNQKSGLIINITSIAAYMGLPYRGVYSATKAALHVITEALRMETKKFGIRVCTIAPGDYVTNIAKGRYHTPLHPNSPYAATYKQILTTINEDVDKGRDPIEVAKLVHRIIKTTSPKVHYKVGSPLQKISVLLKNILPSKIYERLLLRYYKL